MLVFVLLTLLFKQIVCQSCLKPDVLITQNVANEGFHREIKYLIEIASKNAEILTASDCKLALRQDIPSGMFVSPDQIADLLRLKKVLAFVVGNVNVETPMHLSEPHTAYIYHENISLAKTSLELPIHLRYQRAQITGGFGKVGVPKPSLLIHCPIRATICGKYSKIEAPCNYTGLSFCLWSNVSYQAVTNNIEMMIPIGDLDHYPLVSIVTLLVACAGCIYILSILSTTTL